MRRRPEHEGLAPGRRGNARCRAQSIGTCGPDLATRHLLDLGHHRIGLVAGPGYASTARDRRAGYQQALSEAGIPLDESLIAGDSFSIESGETAGQTLLDRPDRPTAIFAVYDNTAIGVMAAAHALGLRIPHDLSLIGYNDIPIVSRLPVPLSSPPSASPSRRSPRTPSRSALTKVTTSTKGVGGDLSGRLWPHRSTPLSRHI